VSHRGCFHRSLACGHATIVMVALQVAARHRDASPPPSNHRADHHLLSFLYFIIDEHLHLTGSIHYCHSATTLLLSRIALPHPCAVPEPGRITFRRRSRSNSIIFLIGIKNTTMATLVMASYHRVKAMTSMLFESVSEYEVSGGSGGLRNTIITQRRHNSLPLFGPIRSLRLAVDDPYTQGHPKSRGL
jgi:hypothetical protein